VPQLDALAEAVLDFKGPDEVARWLAGLNGVNQQST